MSTPEISYCYCDQAGQPLYYIDRMPGKKFRGRVQNGRSTKLEVPKEIRVLYHLDEVVDAIERGETIHLCEGEKDADAFRERGLIGTTNPFGAKSWQPSHTEALRGARVVAYIDKDDAGSERAKTLKSELSGVCDQIEFRQAKEGKDPYDHFAAGHGPKDFEDYRPVHTGIMQIGEFLDQQVSPVEWLVDELLSVGSLAILVAKPKVGKSTLCEELLYCMATGRDFLGRKVRQGRTLFMALEAAPAHLIESLRIADIPRDEGLFITTNANDCATTEQLREIVLHLDIDLVIIDTLARFIAVQDLNDYAEVTKKLTPIAEFCRETGVSILLTHHSRKSAGDDAGDSALGSTAIFGMVDTLLRMRIEADKSRIIESQIRYGRDIEPTKLSFDPATRRMSLGESVKVSKDEKTLQKILEVLVNGPKTGDEVRDYVKSSSWNRVLKQLVDEGLVERTGKGRPGVPFLYSQVKNPPLHVYSPIKGNERIKVEKRDKNVLEITQGFKAKEGKQGTLDELFI